MHPVKISIILLLAFAITIYAMAEKIPVDIEIESHEEVYTLHKMEISIENLRGYYVETSLYPEEINNLRNLGYKVFERLPEKISRQGYHDYYQTESYLDSLHILYPNLTKKKVIGYSVQGKNLSAFLVSDYPDSDEAEPEIKFGATIHGDEPVGTENSLKLISYLLDNYGTDDSITWLVDNTEIWFIPIANPDGRQAGTRYNAHGVDLNRNYPVPDGSIGEDGTYSWEPETEAMIDFCCDHNFVISTMYHGGSLVVNYVWDYSPMPAPDSGLIQLIALDYTWLNGRMWNNHHGYFYHGTVDGWYWYPVHGSIQDWAYDSTLCIDFTIELDSDKWPPANRLPELWDENREAMIYLIEKTHTGITGVVTDSLTGEPLYAEVRALEYGKPVYTDPDVGDYHKLLRDGYYTIQFSSEEYVTRNFDSIYIYFDSLTYLNARLYKPFGSLYGIVRDSVTQNPISGVTVRVHGSPLDPVITDTTGYYSIRPYQGIYDVSFTANGYRPCLTEDIQIDDSTALDVYLFPYESHFYACYDTFSIPDCDSVIDTLYIDESITISDINVYLDITHTYVRDLVVTLISPNLTHVTLHNRTGRHFPIWFDANNPGDGPGSLGDFIGENSYGNWILSVKDMAGGDTGRVNEWAIRLFSEPTTVIECHDNPTINIYPNPFSRATGVSFNTFTPDYPLSISIYDITGRMVRKFTLERTMTKWDGRDQRGDMLPPGVYFYRCMGKDCETRGKLIMMQ